MPGLSEVKIVGRLAEDPKPRARACELTVAFDKLVRNADGTDGRRPIYCRVDVHGAAACDTVARLRKDDEVVVVGELGLARWVKINGENRQSLKVDARRVAPLPRGRPRRGAPEF